MTSVGILYPLVFNGLRLVRGVGFFFFFFPFDNQGTFHGQALKTLHGNPNLGVLTGSQQSAPGKFKVSLVAKFEPRTICRLLGPHFQIFPHFRGVFYPSCLYFYLIQGWFSFGKEKARIVVHTKNKKRETQNPCKSKNHQLRQGKEEKDLAKTTTQESLNHHHIFRNLSCTHTIKAYEDH